MAYYTCEDWQDYSCVVAYAEKLGKGLLVVKHRGRDNYNICHLSRKDRWDVKGCEVLYSTGKE